MWQQHNHLNNHWFICHSDVHCNNYLEQWEDPDSPICSKTKVAKNVPQICLSSPLIVLISQPMGGMHFADSCFDINTVFIPILLGKVFEWKALWASVCTLATKYSVVDCSGIQSTNSITVCIFRPWPSLAKCSQCTLPKERWRRVGVFHTSAGWPSQTDRCHYSRGEWLF